MERHPNARCDFTPLVIGSLRPHVNARTEEISEEEENGPGEEPRR